jgi:hypothetical protein
MHDVYEHNVGDHEDPLPGPTWILTILGSVLLLVVVLGVTALFFNADERMVDDKTQLATYPQFENLKAEQLARIHGPPRRVEIVENDRVVDTVVIPIEIAMEKIAERAGRSAGTSAAVPSPASDARASSQSP